MRRLPCVTLHQPWASLIMMGEKHIETRSWPAPATILGERIGIHAAARQPEPTEVGVFSVAPADRKGQQHPNHAGLRPARLYRNDVHLVESGRWKELPIGAIVGTAIVSESLPMFAERSDLAHILVEEDELWIAAPTEYEHVGHGDYLPSQGAWRIDSDRPFGDYAPGRFGWVLSDVQPFDNPIPYRGAQGVWYADIDQLDPEPF